MMSDNAPLVTIGILCFNAESSILNALNSALNQTYKNLEILIVDDGSTDNTIEICKKFQLNDERILLYSNKKNIGLTKSLNILINNSEGEYIARQDADDVSLPTRIQTQITTVISENLDACTTRAKVLNWLLILDFL